MFKIRIIFKEERYLNFIVIMHHEQTKQNSALQIKYGKAATLNYRAWKTRESLVTQRDGLTDFGQRTVLSIYVGRSFENREM